MLKEYLKTINTKFKSGISREHSYRGDLEFLIRSLVKGVEVINEPSNVTDSGNPDYVITKGKIPIGYIEAKDIGKDLNSKQYKEQFDRYKKALDNLIITDYLTFQFFVEGKLEHEVRIGEIDGNKIKPLPQFFDNFINLLSDFCYYTGQTIKSPKKLAEMMAGKAKLLQNIIENALTEDEKTEENTSLHGQYETFKQILIHDLTLKGFADIYAQTLAYGMFAARLHDTTLDDFSRYEAAELIPKSNPFLKKLFIYIAGPDIDERIKRTVDNLADVFRATNVEQLLKNFGKNTHTEDPIIHFYETFLTAYDPKLRKSRGVWYTPEPVVKFIVRAVDDILKTEFDLPQGLADTSKTNIKLLDTPTGKEYEKEVHKVQILDPATGTGTFLAEVVRYIYDSKFKAMQGAWSGYVDEHLIPRLNGFELLMASYSMAHLKLDMLLRETGYEATKSQRFNIYLTNSLEEHHPDTGTLFSSWLSTEANEANHIKRDTPVMVVLGNPPYSGESANKGKWIMNLMEDYKKEPGGIEKLKERNPKWINDDYVKFIRYAQYYIEKNGSGILAFINPHGYLDNPTFRGMRWNLLKTFDKIYTMDLHGNSKKKETAPDGSKDENVFDIMQGVSINIFVKDSNGNSKVLSKVFHTDIYGKRNDKYEFLNDNSIASVDWQELEYKEPHYFFVPKDFDIQEKYDSGFKVNELFPVNNVGIVTSRDSFVIDDNKANLEKRIKDFFILNKEELFTKYGLKENKSWKIDNVKNKAEKFEIEFVKQISYRPFDTRFIYYNDYFIERSRTEVMQHLLKGENVGLVYKLGNAEENSVSAIISKNIIDFRSWSRPGMQGGDYIAPLYLYSDDKVNATREPNLNMEIVNEIAERLGLEFVPEKFPSDGGVSAGRGGGEADSAGRGGSEAVPAGRGDGEATKNEKNRNTQNYLNLPFNPKLKQRARELRKAGNLSEVLLWKQLKNKQFKGYDFDRQKIIGNYIVDFYCTNCNAVIEVDGSSHDDKAEYDAERDAYLKGLGLEVLHIRDIDVKKNMDGVMRMLKIHPAFEVNHPVLKDTGDIPKDNHPVLKDTPPMEGNYGMPDTEKEGNLGIDIFAPIDILDYIYAVLHSPAYREKYKEFLKIDFPRVPYPKDAETFWKLVEIGKEIREIHLLESPKVEEFITTYPVNGDNIITTSIGKKDWFITDEEKQTGRIMLNDKQYFDGIPLVAWEFYIGGYQPAQKWLKDRKGRELSFEDILHYQKIIIALTETDRLMKLVDEVGVE